MNTSDTLNLAADLIEERGWTRGEGWPGRDEESTKGRLCLEGGLMAAMGMDFSEELFDWFAHCPAYLAVRDYLDWERKLGQTYLFQWNDRVPTEAAEVVEVLRAAAVVEAARESQPVSAVIG